MLNDAGFARRPKNSFVRRCEVGLDEQGSFAILQLVIVELEKGGFDAFAKTDNDADGPSYIYKSTPIGTFETAEEAIATCEEWEAIENGKRILMPEQYRKKDIGVDWINGPCLAVPYSLHQISAAARQSGKTFAAVGEALQKGLSLEMLNIISDLKLKPNHDEEKP